jgi:hypothetical protein
LSDSEVALRAELVDVRLDECRELIQGVDDIGKSTPLDVFRSDDGGGQGTLRRRPRDPGARDDNFFELVLGRMRVHHDGGLVFCGAGLGDLALGNKNQGSEQGVRCRDRELANGAGSAGFGLHAQIVLNR